MKSFRFLPTHCPSCKSTLEWDETETNIRCVSISCGGQNSKRVLNFFKTLEIKHVSEGTVATLISEGYNTIDKILRMDEYDCGAIPGFGRTKAKHIVKGLKSAITNVPLAKIQDATNIFENFGQRKLSLFGEFNAPDMNPGWNYLCTLDGVSDKTAERFINGYDEFWDFIAANPMITIQVPIVGEEAEVNEALNGVVFTGFRDKELEEDIVRAGGVMNSGVSKKTKIVICKDPDGTSSKLVKARKFGCKLMTKQTFIGDYLGSGDIMDL